MRADTQKAHVKAEIGAAEVGRKRIRARREAEHAAIRDQEQVANQTQSLCRLVLGQVAQRRRISSAEVERRGSRRGLKDPAGERRP